MEGGTKSDAHQTKPEDGKSGGSPRTIEEGKSCGYLLSTPLFCGGVEQDKSRPLDCPLLDVELKILALLIEARNDSVLHPDMGSGARESPIVQKCEWKLIM